MKPTDMASPAQLCAKTILSVSPQVVLSTFVITLFACSSGGGSDDGGGGGVTPPGVTSFELIDPTPGTGD